MYMTIFVKNRNENAASNRYLSIDTMMQKKKKQVQLKKYEFKNRSLSRL